jgi:hypothetical protein
MATAFAEEGAIARLRGVWRDDQVDTKGCQEAALSAMQVGIKSYGPSVVVQLLVLGVVVVLILALMLLLLLLLLLLMMMIMVLAQVVVILNCS